MNVVVCSLFLLLSLVELSRGNDGVMYSKVKGTKDWTEKFCIAYNPWFKELPIEKDAKVYNVSDLSSSYGCNMSDYKSSNVTNTIVIVARTKCTFSQKAFLAQQFGAKGIIIASDELLSPGAVNDTDYNLINISVATALWGNIESLKKEGIIQDALLFMPEVTSKFDPNLAVIFLIAVSNIAIGGFWAGWRKHAKYERLKYKRKTEQKTDSGEREDNNENRNSSSSEEGDQDEESVDISIVVIVVFFVLVCGFLVLLYFFYDYLVYVVIVLFCIAGAMGLYYCLVPLWHRVCPYHGRLPKNKVPLFKSRPYYRDLILLAVCGGIAIFWGVQRHASYAWVIQDVLGYAFCLNVMKSIGVPNMKVCTVLLTLLFLYDIFFVFVSPLFTKSGDSIMVKVATGGNSKTHEQLPMVFKVPRLTQDVVSLCPLPFSLLGFGDVIIPGLLVSHNHAFDLHVHSKWKIYYVATCIGYAIGLGLTFIALGLMETGQPALLYLVPCTLITTYVIGCIRGEVKMLWRGVSSSSDSGHVDIDNPPAGDCNGAHVSETGSVHQGDNSAQSSLSSCDNESRELIRK